MSERIEQETYPDDQGAWRDAVPHLDEAMNRLSRSEREAILLRFYEGRTYGEIGRLLGRSEDGTRKQISRSLSKMSRFLIRHGVTVPSVVLGAGLSNTLTKVSLGNVPAKLTAGVSIKGATTGSSVSAWLSSVLFLPPALVGTAAFALLCVLAIGGYHSVPERSGNQLGSGGNNSRRSANPQSSSLTALLTRAAPPQSARPLNAESLATILERAEFELKLAALEANSEHRAEIYLRSIPAHQLRAALDLVRLMEGGHALHYDLTQLLIERWAGFDGRDAFAYAESQLEGSWLDDVIGKSIHRWVKTDPLAAWRWMEARRAEHENLIGGLSITTFSHWSNQNIGQAIDHAVQIPNAGIRSSAVKGVLESGRADSALGEIGRLLGSLSEPKDREVRLSGFVWTWAREDPHAAADWLATSSPKGIERRPAEDALRRQWFNVDARGAADWMMDPTAHDSEWDLQDVVDEWLARDAYGLGEWLAQLELTERDDTAVATFASSVAAADPESGVVWARSIKSDRKRLPTLRTIFQRWRGASPQAADAFIESNQWSAEERAAISGGGGE